MADFLTNLRMQNIFGGSPAIGQPDLNAGKIDPVGAAQVASDFMNDMKNQDLNRHMREAQFMANLRPQPFATGQTPLNLMTGQVPDPNAANGGKPMNTVLGHDPNELTGYQAGELALRKQDITSRENIAGLNSKTREDVAGQNNKTKTDIAGSNLKEKARESDVKDINADQDRAIRQQRANTYDFKTQHPNAQILASKGGNFMLYDPATGQVHDSGVSTGTMTQEAFQEQLLSGRETIAGMQGDTARDVQNMRGQQGLADIQARMAGQQQLQNSKNSNTRPMPPSQQRIDAANRARQLKNSQPELGQYINFDSQGNPVITAGGDSTAGQMINDYLYNSRRTDVALPPDSQSNTNTQPETASSRYKVTIK